MKVPAVLSSMMVFVLAQVGPVSGQEPRGYMYLSTDPTFWNCDGGYPARFSVGTVYWVIDIPDLQEGEGLFGWEGSFQWPESVIVQAVQVLHGGGFCDPGICWPNFAVGTQVCVTAQPYAAAAITFLQLDDTLQNVAITMGPRDPGSPLALGNPAWISCDLEIHPAERDGGLGRPSWEDGAVLFYWDGTGYCAPVSVEDSSWGALKSSYQSPATP